jgi:NAD+ synthase (glutamine-hydrolysing)
MLLGMVQYAPRIGEIEANAESMVQVAAMAAQRGAAMVVFPELSLVGYPPMDLLRDGMLQEKCYRALDSIAERLSIPALVGAPCWQDGIIYNAVYWLHEKQWKVAGRKVLLPNYDVFDESRYFQAGTECSVLHFGGVQILLSICEDLWAHDAEFKYPTDPIQKALESKGQDIKFILNLAASPYSIQGVPRRLNVLKSTASRWGIPVFYVNQVGARADLIFDGGTSVTLPGKEVIRLCPGFAPSCALWDTEVHQCTATFSCNGDNLSAKLSQCVVPRESGEQALVLGQPFNPEEITEALCMGIRDYLVMTGGQKVVIGLSGGVDSAVVLCLAVMALGSENVTALLMPSEFSSERSIEDSLKLCRMHGVAHQILSIERSFRAVINTLHDQWAEPPASLTQENIQPRLRALLLMAFSNEFGSMWLNSSNKSEAAVGYSTLYGDMGGGLSVIGDLYKTQVYALAAYWNTLKEWIPGSILSAAPSAELRPGQLDSDSLPPYSLLDALLIDCIEGGMDEEGLIGVGHDPALVQRILGMLKRSEFKRYQMPPVLRVSSRSFGRGWRRSLV